MSFLNLGDTDDRLQYSITRALELRREHWSRPEFFYRGAGDLLLSHGRFYVGRTLPEQYAPLVGGEGDCFMNALRAAKSDSTLRYCEGVYAIGYGHPTPHAWCLDPNGELLELTMPTQPQMLAIMRDATTGMPFLPPERWSYFGAVFHVEYVDAVFTAQAPIVGLLDRPSHDRLEGGDYTEDREDFPVLRKPYDPDRRTP